MMYQPGFFFNGIVQPVSYVIQTDPLLITTDTIYENT